MTITFLQILHQLPLKIICGIKHLRFVQGGLFDLPRFPTATYKGKLSAFKGGKPTQVLGDLTLKGITKPVKLNILSFKCINHPMLNREVCGADAFATFNRDDFGMPVGKEWGFDMKVTLRIQVEAVATE